MTIADLVGILGAVAGIAVLALMAAVPLLLALPLPDQCAVARKSAGRPAPVDAVAPAAAAAPPIAVPEQRAAAVRRVTTPRVGAHAPVS
ncbi:hypothetical protein WEH80_06280 [Actinomycetes bacterium KLBMP 9759]